MAAAAAALFPGAQEPGAAFIHRLGLWLGDIMQERRQL